MKKINLKKGFTLIEMIVSLGIFTVVALIAVGALLKVMDANRKAVNLKTAINNMNFTIESMSREMRMGNDFYLNNNPDEEVKKDYTKSPSSINPSTSWLLAFRSSIISTNDGKCNLIYAYRYTGTKLQKAQQTKCSDKIKSENFQDIIAPEIKLTLASIGLDKSPDIPDKVYFTFEGSTGLKVKDKTEFRVQSNITQRVMDKN